MNSELIGGIIVLGIYLTMCVLAITPFILLAYGNYKNDMTLFYKYYGFLFGVKYVPAKAKARRKYNRRSH